MRIQRGLGQLHPRCSGVTTDSSEHTVPDQPLPVESIDAARFTTPPAPGLRVTWLGHSTLIIEIDGHRFLTDPVWGERTSPLTWKVGDEISVGANGILSPGPGGGPAHAILFRNSAAQAFTCGIMETLSINGDPLPAAAYCAFPLLGQGFIQSITPLERVLLIFSTGDFRPASVVESFVEPSVAELSTAPGYLVEVAPGNDELELSFSLSASWSGGDGQPVAADEDIVPLLIVSDDDRTPCSRRGRPSSTRPSRGTSRPSSPTWWSISTW